MVGDGDSRSSHWWTTSGGRGARFGLASGCSWASSSSVGLCLAAALLEAGTGCGGRGGPSGSGSGSQTPGARWCVDREVASECEGCEGLLPPKKPGGLSSSAPRRCTGRIVALWGAELDSTWRRTGAGGCCGSLLRHLPSVRLRLRPLQLVDRRLRRPRCRSRSRSRERSIFVVRLLRA